jgi:hypothetical protein
MTGMDLRLADAPLPVAARPGLFLGRLDAAALQRELEEAGLLPGLLARGHKRPSLRTSIEGGEHRLRLVGAARGQPLLDLRAAEAAFLFKDPPRLRLGLEVFSFLTVSAVMLQDPGAPFPPERPRLPGQEHPGLGLLGTLLDRLWTWAEDWGKDGLLVCPPYFHAAVMLAPRLRFVAAARQGRFEALRRDAGPLSLAEASWAVQEGRVTDEAGRPLAWESAEMVTAAAPDLRDYLDSDDYARAAAAARERASYRFSPPQAGQGQSPRSSRKL